MSATRDPDHILHAWLEEGPTVLPAPTVRAIEVATRATVQGRPAIRLPWRSDLMPVPYKLLSAAAALAVVLVGGVLLLGPRGDPSAIGGSSPSPTPSPSAAPSATPTASANLLDTATWTTYVSDRYGFSIAHPADWTEVPGDHDWTLPKDTDWMNTAAEAFYTSAGQGVRVTAWSVPYAGDRLAGWIEAYCIEQKAPCSRVSDQAEAASMDAHDGLLVIFSDDTQAFFQIDGRVYAVAVWWTDRDPAVAKYGGARRLLEAFLSTMQVRPGGPASESPSPSSS
jgi:hypothetical protein